MLKHLHNDYFAIAIEQPLWVVGLKQKKSDWEQRMNVIVVDFNFHKSTQKHLTLPLLSMPKFGLHSIAHIF